MATSFTWDTQDRESDIRAARGVWEHAKVFLADPQFHVVLLDEMTYMLGYDYLDKEEVLAAIRQRPKNQTVVITGRGRLEN